MSVRKFEVQAAGEKHELQAEAWERARGNEPGSLTAVVDGERVECRYRIIDHSRVQIELAGRALVVLMADRAAFRYVSALGGHASIERLDVRRSGMGKRILPPEVTPPMPAVVVEVLVEPGDSVEQGQAVVVVSAMKMESTLVAPHNGVVTEVRVVQGDKVSPGDVLVTIEPAEEDMEKKS